MKQVYLNVFPDSRFNVNLIYHDYLHIALLCHHFSSMKTKQFIEIRMPDLKQRLIGCYRISIHVLETLILCIKCESLNIYIRDLNQRKSFLFKEDSAFVRNVQTEKIFIHYIFWLTPTDIDECNPDPCENGGSCTDDVNGYTCDCADGYTGHDCEIGIFKCISRLQLQH